MVHRLPVFVMVELQRPLIALMHQTIATVRRLLGDIGQHFPDNDPAYSGADSLKLARRVAEILKEHGFRIENIDATLLCQRPKLAPYIPAMRQNLADAFGLPVDAVSVKATTEEHLGFTGEGLGIAAHAVALIETL